MPVKGGKSRAKTFGEILRRRDVAEQTRRRIPEHVFARLLPPFAVLKEVLTILAIDGQELLYCLYERKF